MLEESVCACRKLHHYYSADVKWQRKHRCHLAPSLCLSSSNISSMNDASVSPQIWGLVAGDNSELTKPQFYSTLRLISLAQVSVASFAYALCIPWGARKQHRPTLDAVGSPESSLLMTVKRPT